MWIVWYIGEGSWRRKVTVWLPLPKDPDAALVIRTFPDWRAKRDNEDSNR
jgi:hypothetical protein